PISTGGDAQEGYYSMQTPYLQIENISFKRF
ncbi:unnamed protein product, partial [marine sediment metagenome]